MKTVKLKTVELKDEKVVLIDQTLLPSEIKFIECENVECIAEAIESLRVRGAPAIGVTAALGLAMVALQNADRGRDEILQELLTASRRLEKTRPTAVNLFWAIERMMEKAKASRDIGDAVLKEALSIYHEDVEINKKMGGHGAKLIKDGDVILTHCNAGALATAGIYGTALGVIKVAWENGKKIKVIADETRPLLQGARLTAFEMCQEGIPVTVITDGMAAIAMKKLGITKVIVGADRIAANGDVANKIGTYGVAVLAKEHEIPFYVAAPRSTIDTNVKSGDEIPIEFRDREEMEFFNQKRIVPTDAEIFSPAFDVTPNEYVAGIITEKGVLDPPFTESIKRL